MTAKATLLIEVCDFDCHFRKWGVDFLIAVVQIFGLRFFCCFLWFEAVVDSNIDFFATFDDGVFIQLFLFYI